MTGTRVAPGRVPLSGRQMERSTSARGGEGRRSSAVPSRPWDAAVAMV